MSWQLDERPAIDQLADPEPVAYCWSCGRPISEHSPEVELGLGCVRNRPLALRLAES